MANERRFDWKVDGLLIAGVVAVLAMAWFASASFELREVVASGLGIKLLSAACAVVFVRMTLLIFDTALGHNFKHWINGADNQSKAIYFAARYLGTCLLFALIIG